MQKIDGLFSAQQPQPENLTLAPASGRPGVRPRPLCFQCPFANQATGAGWRLWLEEPPLLMVGLWRRTPLMHFPLTGPSQLKRFLWVEHALKSPDPPPAGTGKAATLPVELGPGGRNRIVIYTWSSLFMVLYKTQKAKGSVFWSQQTTDTHTVTENNRLSSPPYSITSILPEQFPPLPPLFTSLPSPEQSYYWNRLLINTSGFPFSKKSLKFGCWWRCSLQHPLLSLLCSAFCPGL